MLVFNITITVHLLDQFTIQLIGKIVQASVIVAQFVNIGLGGEIRVYAISYQERIRPEQPQMQYLARRDAGIIQRMCCMFKTMKNFLDEV